VAGVDHAVDVVVVVVDRGVGLPGRGVEADPDHLVVDPAAGDRAERRGAGGGGQDDRDGEPLGARRPGGRAHRAGG
jgi:hypothetical protein